MTYAFTYDVPITTEIYARIKEGLGPERPPGLIAHLTLQIEDGLRYIDVWHSKDDFEVFAEAGCTRLSTRSCRACSASCRPSPATPCSTSSTSGPTGTRPERSEP